MTAELALANEIVLSPVAEANLRHDSFGQNFINLYGNYELAANLNQINDDRAVLEFAMAGLPLNSVITSAKLSVYVYAGGGTTGSFGQFTWYGYAGDGAASMDDYYKTQQAIVTFTEGVPPTYGLTTFNVTSVVQSLLAGGSAYDGFLLTALSQNVLVGFAGPGSSMIQPKLDVTYVTVPDGGDTAGLFGAGVAMLFYLARNTSPTRSGTRC